MQQISSRATTVKTDPLYELRFVGMLTIILGIVAAVWAAFRWGDIASPITMLVIALLGAAFFWYLSPWAQVNKRRQLAALLENPPVPLAAEQPTPDETALSLPCKIKLRPKWKLPIICFCVLPPLIGGPLFLYIETAPTNPPEPDWAPLAIAGFSAGVSIFFSALIALIPWLLGWHIIKVTESGLKVEECGIHCWGCNASIKWDEVRLFAIYPLRKRTDTPVCYELASPRAIVRWRRMRPDARFRLATIPVPFEEYDRQMDALLSVIAARTGLPLYDLR